MQVSITFDPSVDSQEDVQGTIAAIFGTDYDEFAIPNVIPAGAPANAQPAPQPAAASLVPQQPASVGAPQVDSTGLPWDKRIHASPASITEKGVWRKRRAIATATVQAVEAELRGAAPAPAIQVEQPAPAPLVPAAPNTPAAMQLPAPVQAPTLNAYQLLAQFIASNIYSQSNPNGRLTDEWVKQALTQLNVPGGLLQNVAAMPEESIKGIETAIRQALGQ